MKKKVFFSFIIAIIVYIVLGLIAWNIVCSIIDVPSQTLVELADYRIYVYSGITFLVFVISLFDNDVKGVESFYAIMFVNTCIAIAVNHWENIWPSVSVIFTIIYNIVNVCFIAVSIMSFFFDESE
jgi:hypothetical protein